MMDFFSAQKMIDFFPSKAGKGPAVQFLQKKWGLKPSECIALFDDDNDIKMVEHCEAGFLPGITKKKKLKQTNNLIH